MITVIKKERGLSSFACIKNFARKNNYKKIGHSGTLDPIASGLLLVAIDEDTKLLEFIKNKNKKYIATAKIGFISNTYDSEGEITSFSNYIPTEDELDICLKSFIGKQKQIPPNFSAKKINGKRAYDLAREGKEFSIPEVDIEIFCIELISYDKNEFVFSVEVSNGTYIRSLIMEIGNKLSCGAYMTELNRTIVNGVDEGFLEKNIPYEMLFDYEKININDYEEIKYFLNGFWRKEWKLVNGLNALIYKNIYFAFVLFENDKIIKRKIFIKQINKITEK